MVTRHHVLQFRGNHACNFKSSSCNYSPDYSLNCTPLSPITIILILDANCINTTLLLMKSDLVNNGLLVYLQVSTEFKLRGNEIYIWVYDPVLLCTKPPVLRDFDV